MKKENVEYNKKSADEQKHQKARKLAPKINMITEGGNETRK